MSLPKVEDAFEVWLAKRHPSATRPVKLRGDLHELARGAFLAGAEYGAAAGAPTLCRGCGSPLTPKPDNSGDFEACENCGYGKARIEDFSPPEADRYATVGGVPVFTDHPGESAKGGRADSPAGAASDFCTARYKGFGLGCCFQSGHKGRHSWQESTHADYFVMDEAAETSPTGDETPICAAVLFAGGLPCTFPRGHVGGMHSWSFPWANRAPDESAPALSIPFHPKPPLGVMPQRLWHKERAQELARAIYDHLEAGMPLSPACPADDWIHELGELWETL